MKIKLSHLTSHISPRHKSATHGRAAQPRSSTVEVERNHNQPHDNDTPPHPGAGTPYAQSELFRSSGQTSRSRTVLGSNHRGNPSPACLCPVRDARRATARSLEPSHAVLLFAAIGNRKPRLLLPSPMAACSLFLVGVRFLRHRLKTVSSLQHPAPPLVHHPS
jgi:hypothetical protein